ncbi:MAG TPA: ACT domain-containing protein [Firmicutes bacterium]|nr:ACT domain-containing protein [Bacillota bacterium]
MRAVITVIGKDTVGILARISTACAEHNINVSEVTQSILQDLFVMIMMVDISKSDVPFTRFSDEMAALGREMGLSVHAMHEDIFNSMHRI